MVLTESQQLARSRQSRASRRIASSSGCYAQRIVSIETTSMYFVAPTTTAALAHHSITVLAQARRAKHGSMFLYHGSSLANWHGDVRCGLASELGLDRGSLYTRSLSLTSMPA